MYCVKCGVKLQEGVESCPLCRTPVWNPDKKTEITGYSDILPEQKQKTTVPLAVALTIISAVAIGVILAICLKLYGALEWGGYAISGILMVYITAIIPLWFRKPRGEVLVPIDHLAAALCIFAHDRGEVNIAFQMPIYPMLDDRDTPSSADNHAFNWNTKRNRKAWRRYLRNDYGTDRVPSYAAPARRKNLKGLPPCYTFVGDVEPFFYEPVDYVRRLREAGVEASCDVYHNWFHAYDLFFPSKRVVRLAISRFENRFEYAVGHYFAPQKEKKEEETC